MGVGGAAPTEPKSMVMASEDTEASSEEPRVFCWKVLTVSSRSSRVVLIILFI